MNKWLVTFPGNVVIVIDAKTTEDFLRQLNEAFKKHGPRAMIEDLGTVQ